MVWLLALQLFAFPVTNAYASQIKDNVVVSVTYEEMKPLGVCTFLYALDDEELRNPIDSHCWVPDNVIGSFDTWKGMRIDEGNFGVVVRYPNGKTVTIYLVTKVNT